MNPYGQKCREGGIPRDLSRRRNLILDKVELRPNGAPGCVGDGDAERIVRRGRTTPSRKSMFRGI